MEHSLTQTASASGGSRRGRGNIFAGITTIVIVVAVLFGSLFWLALKLREQIRAQIVQRDAQVLNEVARLILAEELPGVSAGLAPDEPAVLIPAVLRLTAQKGVLGARLYDGQGEFVMGFPGYVTSAPLPDQALSDAKSLNPSSRYHASMPLDALVDPELAPTTNATESISVREITIPLHHSGSSTLAGIAQLMLEGSNMAAEFERLDRQLANTGLVILICGGLVVTGVMLVGWHRVNQSRRKLAERSRVLEQTNQELMLALKTSAVGTVTTHLLHGLKSPLAGLKTFALRRSRSEKSSTTEWERVLEVTQKMQSMVENITGILRNTDRDLQSQLPSDEYVDRLKADLSVRFPDLHFDEERDSSVHQKSRINGRNAHLCRFILEELLENAFATSREKVVLKIVMHQDRIHFDICDDGPGIPPSVQENIFQPVQSTREGGTGIGLALCRQLAAHMNAELKLIETSSTGTTFSLSLPLDASNQEVTDKPAREHEYR